MEQAQGTQRHFWLLVRFLLFSVMFGALFIGIEFSFAHYKERLDPFGHFECNMHCEVTCTCSWCLKMND